VANEEPEGFGGWLLLVAIGQWLGVLWGFADLAASFPDWIVQWRDPALHRATAGEAGLTLGLLAFMLYTAVVMNMKRQTFPLLFRIQAVLYVVVPLFSVWWVSNSAGTPVDRVSFAGIAMQAIAGTIGASITILYSLRSARVRNTFVY
jgi:Protein of unknown function (DUF2569)